MNNNAAAIYGGGYNSDVTGDIFIHIKENSLISEETVWGGGTGDSTITGGVTITVDDSTEVIGEIHAGGNEGADVIGNVSITARQPGQRIHTGQVWRSDLRPCGYDYPGRH